MKINHEPQRRKTPTGLHATVTFQLDNASCASLHLLTTLLQKQLREKRERKWNGRVVLYENPDTYIFNVFTQTQEVTFEFDFCGPSDFWQLKDGNFMIEPEEELWHEYSRTGKLIKTYNEFHSDELTHCYELNDGRLLMGGSPSCIYNRQTYTTYPVTHAPWTSILKLSDGTFVLGEAHEKIHIFDSSFRLVRSVPHEKFGRFAEYEPRVLMCYYEKKLYKYFIDTDSFEHYTVDAPLLNCKDIVVMKNGTILLLDYLFVTLQVIQDHKEIHHVSIQVRSYRECMVQVSDNVVALPALGYIWVFDSQRFRMYPVPMRSRFISFVFD
jgi:hypothetical protein